MPTTEVGGLSLTNIGPLTTTWTAPESCSTRGMGLASTEIPFIQAMSDQCSAFKHGDCHPSGEAKDSSWESMFSTDWQQLTKMVSYYSPANACPDSWTTAGIMARDEDGSLSSSGYLTTETEEFGWVDKPDRRRPAVLSSLYSTALEEGETVVVCCPDGYTAQDMSGCYSNYPVSSYTASTGCRVYYEVEALFSSTVITSDGQEITSVTMDETELPTIQSYVVTLEDEWSENSSEHPSATAWQDLFVGYAYEVAVVMIHRANESESDNVDGGDDDSNDGGTEDSEDDENVAQSWKSLMRWSIGTLVAGWGVIALMAG